MKKELIGIIFIILISVSIFISGIGADDSNNIDNNNIDNIKDPDLKFVVIGDPHIRAIDNNDTGAKRLKAIVQTVNKMDIDLVVIMGDITDKGTRQQYQLSKNILNDLNKPYFVVIGNHDIMKSDKIFQEYYGSPEKIETIKGRNGNVYQLLFIGTNGERDSKGNITNLSWSFDFDKTNKTIPTLVFAHTPIRCPSAIYVLCKLKKKLIYGKGLEQELDKFTNLFGVFGGHIHRDTNETRNGVRYVTVNGLVSIGIAGIYAQKSDYIGYAVVKDGVLYYQLIYYKKT